MCAGSKGIIGKIPGLSWIPAIGYIVFDVADKFKKGEDGTGKTKFQNRWKRALCAAFAECCTSHPCDKRHPNCCKKACDKIAKTLL